MKINIHELNKKSEVTFKGEQRVSLKGINPVHDVLDCMAFVEGVATKSGNRYLVKGHVTTTVLLLCDRCLEEYKHALQADLYKEYSSEEFLDDEDEDIVQVTGSEIDLEDAITEAIYLNVPMKGLHDDNCKGICKTCGQNLNKQSCNCEKNDIDPRLESLKNIFHPQSEE
ncbi:DUF177 domain-containing protein [Cellulosilyticum sp. ST5]|uniref:YceD family protein n=1 Tax=unclassified Cellulosilyticum TaxID=2643091 RepID=UPI000F8D389F|nr:DUF177 domain-containing protein [Cellulosilyticum sp. WCF-2]QEH69488.1 DUF177 domain-containing protein [Cellulosilyticum sp. WCF-2]